nr:uncharacterized protein LOC127318329 [Lolium perenne]
MSTEEYLSESTREETSADQISNGLEAELAQMDASSYAREAGTGRGQEASSSGQGSGMNLATPTRGTWKGTDVKQPEIDGLYCSHRIPVEACERFPRIAAVARGPCRKRPLDEVDPDPYVVGNKHKMGRTHTSRPDLPSGSTNPQVVEHAVPLDAEVGQEFLDKLASHGRKNKAPASEAGTSEDPPAKRSKQGDAGKKGSVKRYGSRMPVASGPALSLTQSAPGMSAGRTAPEPPNHRAEEDLPSPPEAEDTGASNTGAGTEEAGRAEPLVPSPHKKKKKATASPTKILPEPSAPAASPPAKGTPEAAAASKEAAPTPPAAPTGKPAAAKPTPPEGAKLTAQQLAVVVTAATSPSSGSLSIVLHAGRASVAAGETASAQLGRIMELNRGGADMGHLLDYAKKWNQADMSPATRSLGKDKLPVIDPAGPRSTGQHFSRLRRAVREFDTAWHDANANVVFIAEKEQLAQEHHKALDAQKTLSSGLKDQLMEAELRHSRELKEAQAAAEAKLDESLKEFTNSSAVMRAELEEETRARKEAQDRITTLTTDQAEYDRLVMQADALAFKLFPDS